MTKTLITFLLILPYLGFLFLQKDNALMQDLGRHITLGNIILSCTCVPHVNLFSFTQPGHIFINHHWGSEVLFAVFYALGGLPFITMLKIIIITCSVYGVLYISLQRADMWLVTFFSPFYLYIFSERFDARPEIFTFLFFVVFLFCIFQYRKGNVGYVFLLPVTELLWVNVHIYFIFGPILFSILIFDELIKRKQYVDRRLLLTGTLILFATLINPNFITGALLPLTIFNHYGYAVAENQSPFYLNTLMVNPRIFVFELMVLALIVSFFLNYKRIRLFDFLLSLVAIAVSMYQIRSFPVFALFTLPTISYNYSSFLQDVLRNISHRSLHLGKGVAFVCMTIFVVLSILSAISSPLFGFSYIRGAERGADFFIQHHMQGPIFNNFDIGSYLIFRLYPQEKVFIDGRPEAYSVQFMEEYRSMEYHQDIFDQAAEKYHLNAIFVTRTDATPWGIQFAHDIVMNKKWVSVYSDDWVLILVRNDKRNAPLIQELKKSA